MSKYISNSLEETQKIARDFVSSIREKSDCATVVGLYGDLGAGKTSFTQGVSKALGVEDNIVSPTFVIMKVYEIPTFNFSLLTLNYFIHIDAYRIEKSSELLHLGWQDIVSDSKNLILIEWPERVVDIMPEHIKVNFTHVSENSREIVISE